MRVVITPKAQKDLARLDKKTRDRIIAAQKKYDS